MQTFIYVCMHNTKSKIFSSTFIITLYIYIYMIYIQKQDESQSSRAPKIEKDNAKIDWRNDKVNDIKRKYNAIGHKYDLFTYLDDKMVCMFV